MNWQPGTDRHFLYKNTKMKVELLDIFGNDDMVANAARVSFRQGSQQLHCGAE
jgi:hypothetical protein